MPEIREVKLYDLFKSYINGYTFKSDDFVIERSDKVLPVLKIANVGIYGETDFSNCHYHSFIGYENFIAQKGDLAFSLTGSLGYVSVITETCLVNQRVFVLKRQQENGILLDIIQPLIKSSAFTEYCYLKATSESNKNISPKIILDYKIPIYFNDDGSIDLKAQTELSLKYQDIENKKRLLKGKADKLRETNIYIDIQNNVNFKKVHLNSIVTHYNGKSKYTKEYCQEHSGEVPLYSANNSEPVSFMDKADYCGEYLTYSKNGCAGYITILSGPFSINGDRCTLVLNKGYENINLLYLKYYLEPIFRANIKGRIGVNGKNEYTKLNSTMIKKLDIAVPIPIDPDGAFDLQKQQELARKYATIDSIKIELYNKIQDLIKVEIN